MIDYKAWAFWFSILQFLFNVGLGIYFWWVNRDKVTNARFVKIEERVSAVETDAKLKPVCANHTRMEDNDKELLKRLENIDKGVAKIAGRMEGINRMVDLLTQNELSGGKQ